MHPPEETLALVAALGARATDPGVDAASLEAARAHLATCGMCTAAVSDHRRLDRLLASYSPASRNLCPERDDLLEHAAGALRPRDARMVAAHVERCPLCREDLLDLAALERPPALALVVRWARGIVTLVENALGEVLPGPVPALARGATPLGAETAGVALARDVEDGRLTVSLAPAREGVDVRVALVGRDGGAVAFRVAVGRDGQLLEGRESEEGAVLLDALAPGAYDLSVIRGGAEPTEVSLAIG